MKPISTTEELYTRLNRAKSRYSKRDQMVGLCKEMYLMSRERKSGFFGNDETLWRNQVDGEYWESSNKPQNVVDVMTAVLSGHPPQFQCVIPGDTSSPVPSRAEVFLDGFWRLNSRRHQSNLLRDIVFKTVLHGSCGIRTYWMPDPPDVPVEDLENPDEKGEMWSVQMHDHNTFPICVEVIDAHKLYPGGKGAFGKPYSEIFYTQQRTVGEVVDEWAEVDGAMLTKVTKGIREEDWDKTEFEYVEWWGQDRRGIVWYAICFNKHFIVRPTQTPYTDIPIVMTKFKDGDSNDVSMSRLPFLYPIFWAIDKLEYVRSRSHRMLDMYSQLVPYHAGETPVDALDATWGKILELGPNEKIQFPNWPGQPPDIFKEMQEIEATISEGSFSDAVFGQVSSRVSGYALSQVIGADTLRTDTPRGNLETALAVVADQVFSLLSVFAPGVHLAVTGRVKHRRMGAMLSGEEARGLVTEVYVKPKQTSDEIRLATLGAQIASLPKPPVSVRYILEHYFGVEQPEEEVNRRLDEAANEDPIIKMMAMYQVLQEVGSPFTPIIEGQLQRLMAQTGQGQGQGQAQAPGAIGGMGMGMPQSLGGNEPMPGPTGNVVEEVGPTMNTNLYGGPPEEFR